MSGWTIAILVIVPLAAVVLFGRIAIDREIAAKRSGSYASGFILVRDDGTARELTAAEREHLNGEYSGADSGRPYIKSSYRSLTPDNRIGGYLPRRKLPRDIPIRANDA